jgi:glycosyltransferase involved in cell wall biosynthesis
MNFVFVFADSSSEWNTSQWRSLTPSDGLNTHPDHSARCIPISDFVNYGHPSVQAAVGSADVVIVQRNLISAAIWEACDYWRGVGKLVVADLDDDYPHLLPQNPAYKFWILDIAELEKETGRKPIDALREGFRHVDALVSPNELILQDWGDVVPGYWLPNYAQGDWYKGIKQKPLDESNIVIGWGGSVSHWDGWWFSGLREAVPIVNERYPQVTWKICGGDRRIKRLFDEIAPGRWINQEGVPPQEWPKQVAGFDVGVAPLCGPGSPQGERYDLRRSWLKAVEYLLAGVPWVASEGVVYEKLDSKGGFLVENTPEAWIAGLSEILDNLEQYKTASKKLMRWARKTLTMERCVDDYVEVFQRIITDRNAHLGLRLPNVLYAADIMDQVEELEDLDEWAIRGDLETLADYQRQTYERATTWHEGVGLELFGVDVGRCLDYPVLHTLNMAAFEEVVK